MSSRAMLRLRGSALWCAGAAHARAAAAGGQGLLGWRKQGTTPHTCQIRAHQHTSAASDSTSTKQETLIYVGPLSQPITTLKRVSMTTCALSMVGTPMLLFLGNESVPLSGQLAITGVALTAAVGSTALLHWCTRPYVHSLYEIGAASTPAATRGASSDSGRERRFRAQLLSIFGLPYSTTFALGEVAPLPNALRPFVSFASRGVHYFVQGEVFPDKALLSTLLGRPLEEHERGSGAAAPVAGRASGKEAAATATAAKGSAPRR